MAYLIGIDIGTSGTKTVIFNECGDSVCDATVEYDMKQEKSGWAEQDPNDWWDAVCMTLKKTLAQVDKNQIAGIGLSGQMHGLVMLDSQGEVIRDSIIWCDTRSTKECAQITEKVGYDTLMRITCNPALTGFTLSKLLWVRNHEPHHYEKAAKILLPKDYIRYKLTGEFATEVSDASGMQLLDVPKRRWSDELLQIVQVDKSLLADVYESHEVSGTVSTQAAERTGLKKGTPVVGGGGDQAAGGIGNGIVKPGLVSATIGTSGVVFAFSDKVHVDKKGRTQTFCHAVDGAWHVMGVTKAAGLSLKWFRDHFCLEEKQVAQRMNIDPYVLMDKQAEQSPLGAKSLLYLPYLMGERTPHLDNDAKGVFFGLTPMHTKADVIRSILEGVAFAMKDCLQVILSTGLPVDEIRASGGGGKSPIWKSIQADVYGNSVTTLDVSEGPALGVALLAGTGVGIWKDVAQACEATIKVKQTQEPSAEQVEQYQKRYAIYGALYESLRDRYKELSALEG